MFLLPNFFLYSRNHLTQEEANKQRKMNSHASADYHSIQLMAVVQWKWIASSWKSILASFYALTGYRLEIWTCHNTCKFNFFLRRNDCIISCADDCFFFFNGLLSINKVLRLISSIGWGFIFILSFECAQ